MGKKALGLSGLLLLGRRYKMPSHCSVPLVLGSQACLLSSYYMSGFSFMSFVSRLGSIVVLKGQDQGKSDLRHLV